MVHWSWIVVAGVAGSMAGVLMMCFASVLGKQSRAEEKEEARNEASRI